MHHTVNVHLTTNVPKEILKRAKFHGYMLYKTKNNYVSWKFPHISLEIYDILFCLFYCPCVCIPLCSILDFERSTIDLLIASFAYLPRLPTGISCPALFSRRVQRRYSHLRPRTVLDPSTTCETCCPLPPPSRETRISLFCAVRFHLRSKNKKNGREKSIKLSWRIRANFRQRQFLPVS